MDKQKFYRTSPGDYILACLILISCFGVFLFFKNNDTTGNKKALIFHNNKLIKEIYLHNDKGKESFFITGAIAVEFGNGSIRIVKTDCPQKICKHTGRIRKPGQTIVCVPNKVLIEITGSDKNMYHAVSY